MSDSAVTAHYTTEGLLARIDAGLRAAGADPAQPGFDDLKPVDEFHIGGIEATNALLDQLKIAPGMHVVDLGCGIGGTARHIAHRYGARVTGIDLTPAFIEVGRELNQRLGVSDQITLEVGSITVLPLEDACADLAVMQHVGMNVPDKDAIFAEAARVLRPGGHFAVYDVMRDEDAESDLELPVPWAETPEVSHVAPQGAYRRAAHAAGLSEKSERNRRDYGLNFFQRMVRRASVEGAPPLGTHLLMRETAPRKIGNMIANMEARRIAPVEMIFVRPTGR